MINVSEATKQAYLQDSNHKTYRIVFPELGLSFTNDSMVKESLSMTEALTSSSSIEFVGCISTSFKVKLFHVTDNVKGKKIEAYVRIGTTDEVPIFKGIVDSAKIQAEHAFKEIVAYDKMYTTGLKDVASWYNGISYPITLGAMRKSLEQQLGLETDANVVLPNDNIVIPEKQYENVQALKAITILKSLCQVNGVFGVIRRADEKLEYRVLGSSFEPTILGDNFFLGDDVYLGTTMRSSFSFNFYKECEYEEYSVKPVQRVKIRQSEEDSGIVVGAAKGSTYIIQGNIFTYGLPTASKQTIANNILANIGNVSFHPCNIKTIGAPFLEVGDVISYPIRRAYIDGGNYNINTFIILNRTLSGDQVLNDNYIAEGSEEQSEFITDIQAQLNTLKTNVPNLGKDYYTADQIDDKLEDITDEFDTDLDDFKDEVDMDFATLETPTGFNVVSCYTLPASPAVDTIYLIQGGVIMR